MIESVTCVSLHFIPHRLGLTAELLLLLSVLHILHMVVLMKNLRFALDFSFSWLHWSNSLSFPSQPRQQLCFATAFLNQTKWTNLLRWGGGIETIREIISFFSSFWHSALNPLRLFFITSLWAPYVMHLMYTIHRSSTLCESPVWCFPTRQSGLFCEEHYSIYSLNHIITSSLFCASYLPQ